MDEKCNQIIKYKYFEQWSVLFILWSMVGAQRNRGRVLDSRWRGRGFEPRQRHCFVSLSKNINPSLVLVQPRKTRPFITEWLLMGCKESNQTNKSWSMVPFLGKSKPHKHFRHKILTDFSWVRGLRLIDDPDLKLSSGGPVPDDCLWLDALWLN